MRNKRGKLLGFMLTLALVIGLLPVMSLTAYAETTKYKIIAANSIADGTLTLYMAEAEPGTAVPVSASPKSVLNKEGEI